MKEEFKIFHGKKLKWIFEWFCWRSPEQLFAFEGGFFIYISSGHITILNSEEDAILFLDKKKISKIFYTDKCYKKRTALEAFSKQKHGSAKHLYIKHKNILKTSGRIANGPK